LKPCHRPTHHKMLFASHPVGKQPSLELRERAPPSRRGSYELLLVLWTRRTCSLRSLVFWRGITAAKRRLLASRRRSGAPDRLRDARSLLFAAVIPLQNTRDLSEHVRLVHSTNNSS